MVITVKTQQTRIPLSAADIRQTAGRMLKAAGVRGGELSIVFLKGSAIRKLNRDFLGHDFVTDVVTFNLKDSIGAQEHKSTRAQARKLGMRRPVLPGLSARTGMCSCAPVTIEGEIYICPAEARRNSRKYGEPMKRELLRYLAHGILHLLGFDDATAAGSKHMRALEDKLLEA